MRRIPILLMLVAGSALSVMPAQAASGVHATGHGTTYTFDEDGNPTGKRQFSFSAIEQKSGEIAGQAQLNNPAYDFRAHFDVQCLRYDPPNIATVGAVVTKSNDPGLPEGTSAFWTVVDNGEGGEVDTISGVYFDQYDPVNNPNPVGPEACEDTGPDDFVQMPIEGGNIQVKPAS